MGVGGGKVQISLWSIRPAYAGLIAILLIFILFPVLRKLKESSIFSLIYYLVIKYFHIFNFGVKIFRPCLHFCKEH